jgi:glycosyltransferase involved in cell wall biosynthesis
MENSLQEKVKQSINILRDKQARIYFLVQDTKGNAKASVRYIYQMAKTLKDNGFNPIILHEKSDYAGVASWLDEEYMLLPHRVIEGQNLEVSPEDFIVVPEVFAYVMEQINKLPCAKIVLAQSYAYIVETLQPGQSWNQFGFFKCITTTEKQREYIEKVMRQSTFDIITPYISDNFTTKELPPMPIVAIHTKEQSDSINLIKTFYLKFPQYRWFTFRDMRGLTEKAFSNALKDCFLSVWVDDESGFGTFPLESMASGVPVIGKIPDLSPEWMNEENGIWITDKTLLCDVIADFIQNWLEDNVRPEMYDEMKKTSELYKNKQEFESKVVTLFEGYLSTRADSFEQQISKTEE